ncbi:carbonic anhydrase [Carbonactinospora thermoautotrophica]|uniref:carbonic anhydrase n=1 Tax=Carbonactinospora thermoautotrophica TaxID=1469144 RepID=UPI00227018EF|nr:carbonic anhydrase [Carbonactinospora thermoautotrophica]
MSEAVCHKFVIFVRDIRYHHQWITRNVATPYSSISMAVFVTPSASWELAGATTRDPEQVLDSLLEGNHRFARDRMLRPNTDAQRRLELVAEQRPHTLVLSCADSRVPPELIFDQGLGDLFVVRSAGHVLDDGTLASIEFGVSQLRIPLLMVLGHTACGAAEASVMSLRSGQDLPGHLKRLVERLRPAYEEALLKPGDLVENTIVAHVRQVARAIRENPVVAEAVEAGRLAVVAARYDMATGRVELL